mgnify:FL=1
MEKENKFKLPSEMVDLPSKGLLYPEGHPLSSGQVEIKYMTAREEDILTNQNYLKDGTVIDKLLRSLILTKFNYNDLLVGDKNAILIASRILGYGKDYSFQYDGEEVTVDLSQLPLVELNEGMIKEKGVNAFEWINPSTKDVITFKLLNGHDENSMDEEKKGLKRITKNACADVSTRLKYQIIGINDETDKKSIREYVDNYLLARDSAEFRKNYKTISPDIRMTFINQQYGEEKEVVIPMESTFLWPDTKL